MGYFHSPARPLSQQSSSYRGRSSPSLHVRQNNRQSVGVVAHHYSSHFPTSSNVESNGMCAVVGGGGAFASPQPQRHQYVSSSSQQSSLQSAAAKGKARHATAHMKRAAPQDRNSFVPIAPGGGRSPANSPTQRSSTPSSQAKKKQASSPADNKKFKMELCKNFLKKGGCPFGSSCHFAHGFAELILPDPRDLVREGKLLYICEIWASTGAW